jgi:hypothetical protein
MYDGRSSGGSWSNDNDDDEYDDGGGSGVGPILMAVRGCVFNVGVNGGRHFYGPNDVRRR